MKQTKAQKRALKSTLATIRALNVRDSPTTTPEACLSKTTFASPKGAAIAAENISDRSGTKMRPYRCNHCGLYHLTSRENP